MKVEKIQSKALALRGNDIDTDSIIPARFMKCVTFEGLGEYAFYDQRFDGKNRLLDHPFNNPGGKDASILLVNKNFGCGSSREHAPQALRKFGIQAIVGESFAEIFAGNCNATGIPVLTASEKDIGDMMELSQKNAGTVFSINISDKTVQAGGKTWQADMPAPYQNALLTGKWDTVTSLLENEAVIESVYEKLPYTAHQ